MVLGLKYCGGCSARFDRVELAETIKQRLGATVEWVSYDNPEAEHLLVIAGCESACVDLEPFQGKKIHMIFREQELESIIQELTQAAKGTD